MSKFLLVLLCLCTLLVLGGCHGHRAARAQGYAAIKAKMSTKEIAGALGLAGSGNPEKQHCGKCYAWTCAGCYIKGYAETGEEVISRFSIFSNDGRLLADGAAATQDPRFARLRPPMRYAAVCAVLGGKGTPRTLLAYTWKTSEGQVTVECENGKAYHKALLKADGSKDEVDLCPTAPLWDAPPPIK